MSPPPRTRPRLVYDDDCGFCTWCARWAVRIAPVDAVGFAEVSDRERAVLPDDWEGCVHLVVGRTVYSCGEAIEQTLARSALPAGVAVGLLRSLPGYERARERGYRWAADRRADWGRLATADSLE